MYGLTDNIVAGPAGHTVAAPAGSFVAGPAGSFTPGPAGQTPVSGAGHVPFTEAGHVPITEGGHVPIDSTPAYIPYTPPGGGMHYTEGSTLSPIPGPSAHVPVSQASGGGGGASAGGGVIYTSGGGGGGGGGGASAGGGGVIYSSGGGGGGGGGGSGGALIGGSGGGGIIAGGGGSGGGGGAASMSYTSYSGPGMPPMELRVGQAVSMASGTPPTTPSTEGFTVSPGGRTVPTPVGYVHPPPASRFHGTPMTHVAHHPTRVENFNFSNAPYQAHVGKAAPYEPPHILFPSERPGPAAHAGDSSPNMHITQVNNQHTTLDFTQPRNVQYATNIQNDRNVALDFSEARTVNLNQTDVRETNNTLDFSHTSNTDLSVRQQNTLQLNVQDAVRVMNLFFLDGPTNPAAVSMGDPIMAHKA